MAEALSSPDKSKWEEAMEGEMESLHSNEVWELVKPPQNRKIVGSKWVFKRKLDADGTVIDTKHGCFPKVVLKDLVLTTKKSSVQLFTSNQFGQLWLKLSNGCVNCLLTWRTFRRGIFEAA